MRAGTTCSSTVSRAIGSVHRDTTPPDACAQVRLNNHLIFSGCSLSSIPVELQNALSGLRLNLHRISNTEKALNLYQIRLVTLFKEDC